MQQELEAAELKAALSKAAKATLLSQQEEVGIDSEAAEVALVIWAAVTVESPPPVDRLGHGGLWYD